MTQMPWHVFAAILLLGSTTYSVDPQHRGRHDVRPAGTLSNGLHVKAPWQSVTEMNGTIQIDNHTGEARHYGQAGQQFDRFRRRQRARAHPTRGRR